MLFYGYLHFISESAMNNKTLHGIIIHGDRIGRTLGFPTANVQTSDPLPERGVYIARMEWESGDGWGMLNIGTRPTIQGTEMRVEMHLTDFQGDLYGQHVTIRLIRFLRKEIRFQDIEALRQQLLRDRKETETFLASHCITNRHQDHE